MSDSRELAQSCHRCISIGLCPKQPIHFASERILGALGKWPQWTVKKRAHRFMITVIFYYVYISVEMETPKQQLHLPSE